LINDSEMAILFKPYFAIYSPLLKLNGGIPIFEDYDESNNWNINVDNLEKSLKKLKTNGKLRKVKYILITNPNNPTGTVLEKSILREVVDIANEYGKLLISDEIYDEIVYNGAKFTSISQLAKGIPYVILNGMSKDYDSTGFRIGFVIIPEKDKISEILKKKICDYAQMRLSVNAPAQYAAAEAIGNLVQHKRAISSMVKEIAKRANYATKLFNENPILETVKPNGAFYVFPHVDLTKMKIKNDEEFVKLLLQKEGIQLTRGSGFGSPSHIRLVALPPKEILDYSINKINDFCKAYSK